MKMRQKIVVNFLAALILFIGAGLPMVSAFEVAHIPKQDSAVSYLEPMPAAPLILILQKPVTLVSAGWESSLKIPGFGVYNLNLNILYPELTEVGQIFVVDLETFYPCKSLLIFPFHDFI